MAAPPEVCRENGKKGGRPLGAATKLTRAKANELIASGQDPLSVMIRNMKFWDEQSQRIGEQLENLVIPMPAEDDTKEQLQKKDEFRREAVVLLRTFLAARENAQRCAVDAAPFVHPKLQSISINKQTTKTTIKMTIPAPADDKERTYRGDRTVVPFRVAEG